MATPASSFLQTATPAATNVPLGVGPTSQRPVSPVDGFVFSDTTLNTIAVWNGTVWVTVGSVYMPFSAGSSSNYPTNPTFPYLYWNTTTQQLSLWNGSTWVIIGPLASGPLASSVSAVAPPQIVSQPSSLTLAPAASASFTVTATGSGSLTYQWYFNGVSIGGATSNTYTIGSVATSNGGTYTVNVTGAGGTTGSQGAVLTVTGGPVIVTQPTSQSVGAGSSTSFSITATGTAPLAYQWYLNSTAINGATAPTYSIGGAQAANAGSYYCVVTNTISSATSSTVTLTVTTAPYKGTWTSFGGVALMNQNSDVIFGCILNNTAASASTLGFQLTPSTPSFPPGVSYTLYSSSGQVLLTGTSNGGETVLGTSYAIPTSQSLTSFTVVCAYSGALVITGTLSVSGVAYFVNSSVRSIIYGTALYPPNGYAMLLSTSTLTTGSLVNMLLYQSISTPRVYSSGAYTWNFNGNGSAANPSYGVAASPGATLIAYAPPSSSGDVVLELDSN